MGRRITGPLVALSILAPAGCGGVGADAESVEAGLAGGAITIWTDSTELFMEHPALIVGAGGVFAVHLTDLTDFAPLRSGRITLRFARREGGEPLVVVQDTPRSPGIYGPNPIFRQAGVYDLTIEVESSHAHDVLRVPGLEVHASEGDAPRREAGEDEGISFLKEQQWNTADFRTVAAGEGDVAEGFAVTGEIVPVAGRRAVVAAPIGGLIEAVGDIAPGQRVARGVVLAALTPTLADGGGSAWAEAVRELRDAEDELARSKRLIEVDAISRRRLQEAQIRAEAARAALAGLGGGLADGSGRLELRAPIGGVIVDRQLMPGSRVEAGQTLFAIVDPAVVWLRADVPAASAPRVASGSLASFRLAGSDRLYTTRRMVSGGAVIDSVTRTVPVLYEVPNPDGSIPVGAFATVSVRTGRRVSGVVIPASAVLDEDGRPLAYVQAGGEAFEARQLVLGGEQDGQVLVLSGIAAGERVVSGAAYQIRLASLSTAVPAHGHEH
jgi:RND family efflux transporter MFP subunit